MTWAQFEGDLQPIRRTVNDRGRRKFFEHEDGTIGSGCSLPALLALPLVDGVAAERGCQFSTNELILKPRL